MSAWEAGGETFPVGESGVLPPHSEVCWIDRVGSLRVYVGTMKTFLFLSLLCGSVLSAEPVPLFNGKDFTGWKEPKGNIWWTVEDGTIVAENGPKKKGSNLWTEKEYTDFVFEGEFRYEGKVDSGVFIRKEKEQIQIGISGSLKVDMTCSPYIAGKGYPKKAEVAEILKVGEWNKIKIEAKGKTYKVWLAGKQVLDYTSESAAEKGPIGLQLHGGRVMKIAFRNLSVTELAGE
jgi:hypothetical protein